MAWTNVGRLKESISLSSAEELGRQSAGKCTGVLTKRQYFVHHSRQRLACDKQQ